MKVFTIEETKHNQIGTFRCRVLCLEHENSILVVRPCLNPSCPDLGFRKTTREELLSASFREPCFSVDVDPLCVQELFTKALDESIEETDSDFSKQWFDHVATVTELRRFQSLGIFSQAAN